MSRARAFQNASVFVADCRIESGNLLAKCLVVVDSSLLGEVVCLQDVDDGDRTLRVRLPEEVDRILENYSMEIIEDERVPF